MSEEPVHIPARKRFAKTAFDESEEGQQTYTSDESNSSRTTSPEPPIRTRITASSPVRQLAIAPSPAVASPAAVAGQHGLQRLAVLVERNKRLPPHLRESYVFEEIQGVGPNTADNAMHWIR